MELFWGWFRENWFAALQAGGIACSLLFAAITIRRDTEARQTTDLLALAERHHDLWAELNRRPDLQRIMNTEVDLVASPVTPTERAFLNLVFVHFFTGWLLANRGALVRLRTLARDAAQFFSLPLPAAVWKETRSMRDDKFVRFIDSCVTKRQ